jgi:hypothetical protein
VSDEDRFWAKVDAGGEMDCWKWLASVNPVSGYGQFYDGTSMTGAHRFSYRLHHGEIPAGLQVHHRCDVRACVNPYHLWVGTQADNMADMVTKGRSNMGEKCGTARLTTGQVREIRRLAAEGASHASIAPGFGVSRPAVSLIVEGKRWQTIR